MQFFSLLTHLHLIKTMSSLAELGEHNECCSEVRKIVLSHQQCPRRYAIEVFARILAVSFKKMLEIEIRL